MRKVAITVGLLVLVAGGVWYYRSGGSATAAGTSSAGGRGGGPGGRPAMTVDAAAVSRRSLVGYTSVVGNLIGALTVDVVPRVAGRIDTVNVQLGDRVAKGQQVVKIEDREIRLQISQADANLKVNGASVAQRENDLKVAENTNGRVKAMYDQGLQSKQNLEDAEARLSSARSQLLAAQSQESQTASRIDELRVTLSNTTVVSPVDGFVSRRALDPGAFAGANTVILSVVDISTVRLVANVVERDFKRVRAGVSALVTVDAFPGEDFTGAVSRVSPVFDPTTRTAQIEIEVPNPGYRLKPGMYARVRLTVERKENALTVPRNAVVDLDGQRGVFFIEEQAAQFHAVTVGLQDGDFIEIVEGLSDGDRVITTGAVALRSGDRVALVGAERGRAGGGAPPTAGSGQSGPGGRDAQPGRASGTGRGRDGRGRQ